MVGMDGEPIRPLRFLREWSPENVNDKGDGPWRKRVYWCTEGGSKEVQTGVSPEGTGGTDFRREGRTRSIVLGGLEMFFNFF